MKFYDWLFEVNVVNPVVPHQWEAPHILTIVLCVLAIIAIGLFCKFFKANYKTRRIIIFVLTSCITVFEILIRFVYLMRRYAFVDPNVSYMNVFWIMMPKPWCAIACWSLIAAPFVNKKFFYNYASLTAMLCSIIFFAYPGVGFNNEHLLFSNYYSICTHSLLLVTSFSLITLKFTEFKYKDFWKFAICLGATYIYGLIEIYVFKFTGHLDPMYFMPNGDIQTMFGIPYIVYLALYILVIVVFVNSFYLANLIKNKKKKKIC